jgi:cbb3-type cytochrome oxidase subunit 3
MDINLLRETMTIVSFVTFIGILRFAMHPSNKERFEEAAVEVLEDDDAVTLTPAPGLKNAGAAPTSQGRGGKT